MAQVGLETTSQPLANALTVLTENSVPTGVMLPFGGLTAKIPSGWLACDGSAVSRTTYSALFTALGTAWGTGDGSTTFNVPDMRAKFPQGASVDGDVGTTGGSTSYTPAGTNSVPAFTGSAASLGGTISWPAGVPTAANESAHTHSVTSNVTVADHASHTHSVTSNVTGTITPAGTIAWPAGVPTLSGTTINSVATVSGSKAGTSAGAFSTIGGASPGSSFTPTINAQGTIAWPAGVPTFTGTASQSVTMVNNAVTSAGPSATLTHSVTNNAVTSGAGSAHTHTISWPAGVPTISMNAYTPTGTVGAPTFTGTAATIVPPYAKALWIIKT